MYLRGFLVRSASCGILALVAALAGCGGEDGQPQTPAIPTPTPTATPTAIAADKITKATLSKAYEAYSFSTSDIVAEYTYAGVTYPSGIASIFPQASISDDLQKDGYPELIIPLNKAYGTPSYAALPYLYFSNSTGKLNYIESANVGMPSVFGARRAAKLTVGGKPSIFFSAHNVSGIYNDPKAHGTAVLLMESSGLPKSRSDLLPRLTTKSELADFATDAHAMAVGDINGDKRSDIVIGNWRPSEGYPPIFLNQGVEGSFTATRSDFLEKLNNVPNLNQGSKGNDGNNLWLDAHLVDINMDGYDDLIAGFGHGSTHSLMFPNNKGNFVFENSISLPDSIYGPDTDLHMKTVSSDLDDDGDPDLLIVHSRYDPYYGGSYIQYLRNDNSKLVDITSSAIPQNNSIIFAKRLEWSDNIYVIDVNKDGRKDIVYADYDKTLTIYINLGNNLYNTVSTQLPSSSGAGRLVGVDDYDADGIPEFVYYQYGGDQKTNKYYINVYEITYS